MDEHAAKIATGLWERRSERAFGGADHVTGACAYGPAGHHGMAASVSDRLLYSLIRELIHETTEHP